MSLGGVQKLFLRQELRKMSTGSTLHNHLPKVALRNRKVFDELCEEIEAQCFGLEDVIQWIKDHWQEILEILLMIIPLILGEEA